MNPRQLPVPWLMTSVWGASQTNRVTSIPPMQHDEGTSLRDGGALPRCTHWPRAAAAAEGPEHQYRMADCFDLGIECIFELVCV